MNKTIAFLKTNYIPWKGYFDIINLVDEVVFYDSVLYSSRSWRNRNKIKTPRGTHWLTTPVRTAGKPVQRLCDVSIHGDHWRKKHIRTLWQYYQLAPYFDCYFEQFKSIYRDTSLNKLSSFNMRLIELICGLLKIQTKVTHFTGVDDFNDPNSRLLSLCDRYQADAFLTGPAASNYLEPELFRQHGIDVVWMNYADYPPYSQLYGPFQHEVSIVDLLFNEGPNSRSFMHSFDPDWRRELWHPLQTVNG